MELTSVPGQDLVIIRKLESADTAQVVELVVTSAATVKEDFSELGWQVFLQPNTMENTRTRIVGDDYQMYGAEFNNELLGMISIYQLEKIDQLFVAPGATGKGIARALWNHAEYATDATLPGRENHGYYWVRSSSQAVPVYQHFGFSKVGEQQSSNGIRFQLMEKHGD